MAEQKPIANSSVVLREEFDDWAVLFDPESGNSLALDPTGVYIWKRFDGKHTIEDIVRELRVDCSGVPPEANTDCEKFLKELMDKGLVGYEPVSQKQ